MNPSPMLRAGLRTPLPRINGPRESPDDGELNCFKETSARDEQHGLRATPGGRMPASHEPQAVDLRGLPPPEPLERILAAIDRREVAVTFLLAMEPLPLYVILRKAGVRYRVRRTPDAVEITLERSLPKP